MTTSKLYLALLATALCGTWLSAQTFNSGSTGADGALNYTTPGTYVWDPKSFNPPLDADGDGIFHFTTITIAAGVTLRMRGDVYAPAVYWLASGAVKIDGTIDLKGQDGFFAANTTQRAMTIPGSGGWAGGYPGIGASPAGIGLGPGGGGVPTSCDGNQNGAKSVQSNFLIPLIGGSGGAGASVGAGAAGGGAILIASSLSITGGGSILASAGKGPNPGGGGSPGGGAGGGIRLVAPSVTLSGTLDVSLGSPGTVCEQNGLVRIEAFQIGPASVVPSHRLRTATPYSLFLPTSGTIPTIRVVSVGGIPVPSSPTGLFTAPDVTLNSSSSLAFSVQAQNVPLGTVATLTIFSENGTDQVIQSTPLAGTLANSSATATAILPAGFSKGFVIAKF